MIYKLRVLDIGAFYGFHSSLKGLRKNANIIDLLKIVIFLFLNNETDLAIWLLKNKKSEILKSENNNLKEYTKELFVKRFYSIKWFPSQSLIEPQKFFNEFFECEYLEMNKFNHSQFFNPN